MDSKSNKNGQLVTSLVTGMFNVTCTVLRALGAPLDRNFPITFETIKKVNACVYFLYKAQKCSLFFAKQKQGACKAFMDLIKDPSRYQNMIFVFDRGYFSESLSNAQKQFIDKSSKSF